jgi:hypothetical protein
MADDHNRPHDPGHGVDYRAGVVVKRGRRVRARQVDGDRAMTQGCKLRDQRRELGRAAERAVDQNKRRHRGHLLNRCLATQSG